MKKSILLIFTLLLQLNTSFADDLVGNKLSIVVTKNSEGALNFKLCDKTKAIECKQLGEQNYYSIEDLKEIAASEKLGAHLKTGGIITGSIVIAVVGAYTVGAFSSLVASTTTLGAGFINIGSVALGGTSIFSGGVAASTVLSNIGMGVMASGMYTGIAMMFDKLNPFHQYAQASLLTSSELAEGLLDYKDIEVEDEDIEDAAEILDQILL